MFIIRILLISLCLFAACKDKVFEQKEIVPNASLLNTILQKNDSLYAAYKKERSIEYLKTALTFFDTVTKHSAIYISTNDTAQLHKAAQVFLFAGNYQNTLGNYVAADSLLQIYLSTKQKLHIPATDWDAYTYKILGDIYTRFGDYQVAKYYKKQSFAYYLQQKNEKEISSECINLAILHRELGQYDTALAYIKKGLSTNDIVPKRKWYLLIEQTRCLRLKRDTAVALMAWQIVKKFVKSDTSLHGFAQYFAESKKEEAAILLLQHQEAASLDALHTGMQAALISSDQKLNRDIGKMYIQIGNAYTSLRLPDSAIACYNLAINCIIKTDIKDIFFVPSANVLYAENTIGEALQAKAEWMIENASQHKDSLAFLSCAVACYERVNQVLFRLFTTFSYDSSKLNLLAESKWRNEKAIATANKLFKITGNVSWVEKGFQFAESDKAYILAEALKRNLSNHFSTRDNTYKKIQQAKLNAAMLERNLFELQLNHDSSGVQAIKASLENVNEAIFALSKQWQQENHSSSIWDEYNNIEVQNIYKQLKEKKATLFEYFIGESESYLFILTQDQSIQLIQLPDSIQQTTEKFVNFFDKRTTISNNPEAYLATAFNCYKKIAVATNSNTSNLIIIPDGILNEVPFDALVTKNPTTKNLATADYLVNEKVITREFAVKTMLAQKHHTTNKSINIFAPTYPSNRKLQSLTSQNNEINAIEKEFKNHKTFAKDQATLSAFRSSPQADIIHLSAHAFANDRLPPRIEFADSTMYLNELYSTNMNASFAVLSACETGSGLIQQTEGPLSLARAFYFSGANQVISNLWKADDAVSTEITISFYKNLKDELVSASLNHAKRKYLSDTHNSEKYSPYYWAGLSLNGIDILQPKHISNLFFVILFLLLLIVYMSYKHHKKKDIKFIGNMKSKQ